MKKKQKKIKPKFKIGQLVEVYRNETPDIPIKGIIRLPIEEINPGEFVYRVQIDINEFYEIREENIP